MSLAIVVWLVVQGAVPLRESDLVRRNCLTFAPTDRSWWAWVAVDLGGLVDCP